MARFSKCLLVFLLFLNCSSCFAQTLSGFWNGYTELMGRTMRLEFEFTKTTNGFEGTMRSTDQGSSPKALDGIAFDQSVLSFDVLDFKVHFEGTYIADGNTIDGQIFQSGKSYPISLQRERLEAIKPNRPQTPQPPFDYAVEELTFPSKSGTFNLSGTLTTPKGNIKAVVVLVSGSGPQDRNSEILDHKSFWVWADYLAQNGIACLRYDDRGVRASEGDFTTATSFDFANDARAALDYLLSRKEFSSLKVGLMGHSEGGLIASIIGGMPERIDFLISLAGMGKNGRTILETQNIDLRVGAGLTLEAARSETQKTMALFDIAIGTPDSATTAQAIYKTIDETWPKGATQGSTEETAALFNNSINTKWMRTLLTTEPAEYWEKTTCPVLAINGDKDLQVAAGANLRAIQFALRRGGNAQGTFHTFKNHNHLLQETEDGRIDLYGKLEQTISPEVLTFVTNWIIKTTAKN
jgi:pimeloyl-ACP methyl ester carboxylesterase